LLSARSASFHLQRPGRISSGAFSNYLSKPSIAMVVEAFPIE